MILGRLGCRLPIGAFFSLYATAWAASYGLAAEFTFRATPRGGAAWG